MRNALAGIQLALHLVTQQEQTLCEKNVEILGEVFHLLESYIPEKHWEKIVQEFETIDEHEETLNNVISLIRDHTTRAMEVTTLILNYARLGWTEVGGEHVYLPSLIESIIQEHAQEFREQQITLRSSLSSTRSLVGNSAHFYMMINNTVLNARDALLELADGRERVIDISLHENDQYQILHITDNANGIPDDHLLKIFDPFFSTKPTTGTGLGLSVVSKLVPMYHGTIDVTSEEGEGTTFTFTFPVHESSPK
jgi:signal transduction histidine kinase